MQKVKAKKRIIASVLAVCMMVSYGTGSYKTAYAADRADVAAVEAEAETSNPEVTEETKASETDAAAQESGKSVAALAETEEQIQESGTISIDEVPELSEGDTKITEDNKKVEYTDESGQTDVWDGQVFRYTAYGTGTSAVELRFSGTANKNYQMYIYRKQADGTMKKQGQLYVSSDSDKLQAKGLIKAQEYYFVVRGYEGASSDTMYTSAADQQDITITIDNDVPVEEDLRYLAKEVTPGTSYTYADVDDARIVYAYDTIQTDEYGEPYIRIAALYKITLSADTQMHISFDGGYLDVCEYSEDMGRLYSTNDYEEKTGKCEGTLYCYASSGKTYYIEAVSAFTLGTLEQQPEAVSLQSIKDSIPELTKNQSISIENLGLQKQRLSYESDSNQSLVKRNGYWVKVTVPKDEAYYLSVQSPFSTTDSKDYWKIHAISYYTAGNFRGDEERANNTIGYEIAFNPGTVNYLCMDASDLSKVCISAVSMQDVQTAIPLAQTMTESDIENGTISVRGLAQPYMYFDTYKKYVAHGGWLKVTVPAGKAYMFSAREEDCVDIAIFEADGKTMSEYGNRSDTVNSVYNRTDAEQTYYVWVDTSRNYWMHKQADITVEEVEVTASKIASAEKLGRDKAATYKYDSSDAAYTEHLANLGSCQKMNYVKMYEVEEEACTLKIQSQTEGLHATVYVLNPACNVEKQAEIKNGDSTVNVYSLPGEKRYVVIAGDADHLDAQIDLTLTDVEDDRRISANAKEAAGLAEGETSLAAGNTKPYVFWREEEKENYYTEKTGTLLKCSMNPKTGIHLGFDKEIKYYIFTQDFKWKTSGWAESDMDYVNVTDDSQTIYLLIENADDVKMTMRRIDKVPMIKEKASAVKIPDAGYTTKDSDAYIAIRPDTGYTVKDGSKEYIDEEGCLYTFTVPANSHARVQTDTKGNQDLWAYMYVYEDLDELPVTTAEALDDFLCDYKAEVDNNTDQEKEFYIWIPMVQAGITITVVKGVEGHVHAFASDWTSDAEKHWHACTASGCDGSVNDLGEHTAGDWIVDKKATEQAEGSRHKACTVCGYVMQKESIPKLKPQVQAPNPVANLSASAAGKEKVKLTWSKANGADGYLIYAKKDGVYGYCAMTNAETKITYTDTKASGTNYNFYWVYPFKYDANGKRVVGKCTKYVYAKGICTATENIKAVSVKGGVKLTWSKKAGASGYLVYAKRPGGKFGYIGMKKGYGSVSYTDKDAVKGSYTFYWIIPYYNDKNGKLVAGQTGKYVYGKSK